MVPLSKSEKKKNVGVWAFRCEMLIVAATVTAVVSDLKEHRNYYRRRRQLELFAAASAQVGDERRRERFALSDLQREEIGIDPGFFKIRVGAIVGCNSLVAMPTVVCPSLSVLPASTEGRRR